MNRYIIYIIPLFLLLGSCRSNKEVVRETVPEPIAEEAAVVEKHCEHTYGSTPFSCTASGISANGLLRTQCDSVIWVSISKFIELGRIRMTPDSVEIFVKPYNAYYHNTYSDLKSKTGIAIDFAQLQDDLWHNPTAAEKEIARWGALFRAQLSVQLKGMNPAETLTFPMSQMKNPKPLEILLSP